MRMFTMQHKGKTQSHQKNNNNNVGHTIGEKKRIKKKDIYTSTWTAHDSMQTSGAEHLRAPQSGVERWMLRAINWLYAGGDETRSPVNTTAHNQTHTSPQVFQPCHRQGTRGTKIITTFTSDFRRSQKPTFAPV